MTISNEVFDGLLSGCATADDLLGEEGLFKQLKKALLERMLGAEPNVHLGYEKGDSAGRGSGNSRNGYCGKTVLSDEGALDLSIPRDQNGTFEPQLVTKGKTRFGGEACPRAGQGRTRGTTGSSGSMAAE
ncbi:transposase (fragment) [uncultured Defluviicoccus sp.]|uniref:Transposase n=1 Tax=metagenome TaxID=256318 RepID=A0A380TKP0_9ZZZZ